MKDLKDYVDLGKKLRLTDAEVIQHYICNEGLETEYMSMILKLAESKLRKQDDILARHQHLAHPVDEWYRKYTNSDASILDKAQRYYILYNELPGEMVSELAKRIPVLRTPKVIYRDFLLYLEQHGIYFRDAEEKTQDANFAESVFEKFKDITAGEQNDENRV